MKEREYAYLKLHFPKLIKISEMLLSESAFWAYSVCVAIYALIHTFSPIKGFSDIVVLAFVAIFSILIVKGFLKFLLQITGMILYKLFYPETWKTNPLYQDMSGYYAIRRNFY